MQLVSWVLDSFNISKEAWIFKPNFFKSFFQDHKTTYEHKVCGYPNQSSKKIRNNFACNPGCERIFSKHFDESQIPYNKTDNTFNFARFLHQSLEVSTYVHYAYPWTTALNRNVLRPLCTIILLCDVWYNKI